MKNKEKYIDFCKQMNIRIYHQPWWLDTVSGPNNWNFVAIEKGNNIVAVLPYVMRKKRGFYFIEGPPLTQILGPIIKYPANQKYERKLSFEKLIISQLLTKLPKVSSIYISLDHDTENILPYIWQGFNNKTQYTYKIKLNDKSSEEILSNFNPNNRNALRVAKKKNISIAKSENIELFYSLVKKTYKRQKRKVPYSLIFLKGLFKNISNHKSGECFIVFLDKKAIAGALIVYDKENTYYLIGGIDSYYSHFRPMNFLLYEIILYSKNMGKKYFDFEGSMNEGIEKFFRSFGAQQHRYFSLTKDFSRLVKLIKFSREILRPKIF